MGAAAVLAILVVGLFVVAGPHGGSSAVIEGDPIVQEYGIPVYEVTDIQQKHREEREKAEEEEKRRRELLARADQPKPVRVVAPSGPYAEPRAHDEEASNMPGVSRGVRPHKHYLSFKKRGKIDYGEPVLIWSAGKPFSGSLILPDDIYKGRCYQVKINTLFEGKEPCEASDVLEEAERVQKLIYGMGGYRVTFAVTNDPGQDPLCSMRLEKVSCWSER